MAQVRPKREEGFYQDLAKFVALLAAIAGICGVFFVSPALSTPALLSIVTSLFLSPVVAALDRRGYSRGTSLSLIFLVTFGLIGLFGFWSAQSFSSEWDGFRESAPKYFEQTVAKLRTLEAQWKAKYAFLSQVQLTDSVIRWGESTGAWFLKHGPGMMGQLLTCIFIVPLLTFGLVKDGPAIHRLILEMVPNRFFEGFFIATWKIMTSFSDYIRAKLIEAFLVGLLTTAGLLICKAPYAVVLGIIAGVTNILPYIGPIIGTVPGLLIVGLDPVHSSLFWPVFAVYGFANLIDNIVIFPVVVAKLVNLHPVILIVVVMLGQEYYGLVGMLISIPIATGVKIVIQEIYMAMSRYRTSRIPILDDDSMEEQQAA